MTRDVRRGAKIQLGQLTLGEQLGQGGFGIVYKAKLAGINMTFAIKFLDPSFGNNASEETTQRFLREANLLFRFRHPHITPIYGVGEHEGRPYILMEYFSGWNLFQARQHAGQPDPSAILPFIEMIADGLAYAHKNNVVHRDVKPQNLMTKKGDARILDFGVAAILDPGGERFTRTSDAVAGDAFSAPELTENPKLLDPRCDIYSLGACWFWLLTGMSPKGLNWESKLRASVDIPRTYEQVILRCLDQLERRYPTAHDLVLDVRALRNGTTPSQSPHEVTDDQARILGIIVGACPSSIESISFYTIEQELANRQSRLKSSIAIRALVSRKMIEEEHQPDPYGSSDYMVFRPLPAGIEWSERNVRRLEELLMQPEETIGTAANANDGTPF